MKLIVKTLIEQICFNRGFKLDPGDKQGAIPIIVIVFS